MHGEIFTLLVIMWLCWCAEFHANMIKEASPRFLTQRTVITSSHLSPRNGNEHSVFRTNALYFARCSIQGSTLCSFVQFYRCIPHPEDFPVSEHSSSWIEVRLRFRSLRDNTRGTPDVGIYHSGAEYVNGEWFFSKDRHGSTFMACPSSGFGSLNPGIRLKMHHSLYGELLYSY